MRNDTSAPYITIHGPDGSGKTTVGRRVVDLLHAHGREAVFFDDWRKEAAWQNPFSDKELRRQFAENGTAFSVLQLAKVALDSAKISELTDAGIVVIKDRGILDVRADLQYRKQKAAYCQGPYVREPDLAVYLAVSEVARQSRLEVKQDIRPEDFQPNVPGTRLHAIATSVLAAVTDMKERGRIIQTDELSVDQVVKQVYTEVAEVACR